MNNNSAIRLTAYVIAAVVLIGGLVVFKFGTPLVDSSKITLPDTELLDQDGNSVKFASDVVGDRITALNFIYTDCNTACPVVSAIFSRLQNHLGQKLNNKVRLVSVSLNPFRDTPEKLKSYALHFHAGSEWKWLTGEKTRVDALLKELKVYRPDYINHAPVILVGDPIRGEWTRFNGLTSPEVIQARIDELLDERTR